jgi:hypothetical protein
MHFLSPVIFITPAFNFWSFYLWLYYKTCQYAKSFVCLNYVLILIGDPFDTRYVSVKPSAIAKDAGEGAFANEDIPKLSIFSLYGGRRYNAEQLSILNKKLNDRQSVNGGKEVESDFLYRY